MATLTECKILENISDEYVSKVHLDGNIEEKFPDEISSHVESSTPKSSCKHELGKDLKSVGVEEKKQLSFSECSCEEKLVLCKSSSNHKQNDQCIANEAKEATVRNSYSLGSSFSELSICSLKKNSNPFLVENKQFDHVFDKSDSLVDSESVNMQGKIVEGQYYGQAKHKDGSLLPILFEVSDSCIKLVN